MPAYLSVADVVVLMQDSLNRTSDTAVAMVSYVDDNGGYETWGQDEPESGTKFHTFETDDLLVDFFKRRRITRGEITSGPKGFAEDGNCLFYIFATDEIRDRVIKLYEESGVFFEPVVISQPPPRLPGPLPAH